jgi:hypothetical protein
LTAVATLAYILVVDPDTEDPASPDLSDDTRLILFITIPHATGITGYDKQVHTYITTINNQ